MPIIAIFAAFLVIILLQRRLYTKKGFENLEYRSEFSTDTAFVGDDIYLYETLSNDKSLPLPYVKVNTDLENGLKFTLIAETDSKEKRKLSTDTTIQSVFVMKGHSSVKRRFRVVCNKRGVYNSPGALLMISDVFGINTESKLSGAQHAEDAAKYSRLVVLPGTLNLAQIFTSTSGVSGDVMANHFFATDPLLISGSREYTTSDPMNKINWKSSAIHGKLMVNIEDHTVSRKFCIVLNMNTRSVERDSSIPGDFYAIEQSITVCASIIESSARFDIPVRLVVNSEPTEAFDKTLFTVPDGTDVNLLTPNELTASKILASDTVSGVGMCTELLRLLAFVEMKISVPAEAMLDNMVDHPEYYGDFSDFIVVSPYIDERMISAHKMLKKKGRNMILYLTTGRNDSYGLPDDMEVYYRTY